MFPEERQRGCGPDGRGFGKELGGVVEGGETNQNTLYKKYLFPIKNIP